MALPLVLFAVLLFSLSLALVAGTWRADLARTERARDEVQLAALTDAGLALARARLARQPSFTGVLERRVGSGRVRVEVDSSSGSWRRAHVEASWRAARRETLIDLAFDPDGPRVIGWIPIVLDPDR